MQYKFYYYDNKQREHVKLFDSERAANIFFDILVAAKYHFKVITLGGKYYVGKI